MKKYNLYLWFIALVGLITSCSQDEAAGPQNDVSNRVRIGASIEQAVQTRTASVTIPGSHKLRYVLEVWSTGTPTLIHKYEKIATDASAVEFEFKLEAAGDYKALLWADFVTDETGSSVEATAALNAYIHYEDKHYTTTSLKAVALAGTYTVNDESRDAFFACETITKEGGAFNKSITLTRPFGQINIIEKSIELLAKVKSMELAYTVPDVFNVEDGATTGTKSVSPTVSTLPESTGDRKANLFYDFIFAPQSGQTLLGKIAMTFTSNDGTVTLNDFEIPAYMPAERNKRTNISGSILHTSTVPDNTAKLSVSVDDTWSVENDVTRWDGVSIAEPAGYNAAEAGEVDINSAAELAWLAQQCNGGKNFRGYTFNLATDIDLNNKEWTPIGNSATSDNYFSGSFNGQGHTVRNMKVIRQSDNGETHAGFFGYIHGESATVSNLIVEGEVKGTSSNGYCHAGGICGVAIYANFKFCRFNGSVSGTVIDMQENYNGGIVGYFSGDTGTMTCCISNATVTAEGGREVAAGGLIGSLGSATATYSAWNSSNTTEGIGHIDVGTNTSNQSFTDIATLNGLLDGINASQPDSEYMWEANGADAFPKLVKRAN